MMMALMIFDDDDGDDEAHKLAWSTAFAGHLRPLVLHFWCTCTARKATSAALLVRGLR